MGPGWEWKSPVWAGGHCTGRGEGGGRPGAAAEPWGGGGHACHQERLTTWPCGGGISGGLAGAETS